MFKNCSYVVELDLHGLLISDECLITFCSCYSSQLNKLNIYSSGPFSSNSLQHLVLCTCLIKLNVGWVEKMDDSILISLIRNCSTLQKLDLSGEAFTAILPFLYFPSNI